MLPPIDDIYKDFYLNLHNSDMLAFNPGLTEVDEILE